MDTYLTIMVTVLVATQVIRIAQNTIQLHRQNKLIKKEIAHLGDVTQEDFDNQRKAGFRRWTFLHAETDNHCG